MEVIPLEVIDFQHPKVIPPLSPTKITTVVPEGGRMDDELSSSIKFSKVTSNLCCAD